MDEVVALADRGLDCVSYFVDVPVHKGRVMYVSRNGPFFVLNSLMGNARKTSGNAVHHAEAFVDDCRLG